MGASAILLSAGFGTRLRPLSDELPKPLVPLGDRPVLAHIAAKLAHAGLMNVVVNTHHRAAAFQGYLAELPLSVHLVHEPTIRGTAGGVAGARSLFERGPVIAWNGDVLADPDLARLRHAAGDGIAFVVAPRALGEGTVGLSAEGTVVRLRGETFGVEVGGGDYLGILALGPSMLASLPETGCLVGDVTLPFLRRGGRVHTVLHDGPWTDIGTVAAYHTENLRWVRAIGAAAWVHERASVAPGVVLRDSIVGAGAIVDGTGSLDRVVVWPGARVTAPLASAVVTTGGTVVAVP